MSINDIEIGYQIQSEFDQITPELIKSYSKLGGFAKLASNVIHDDEEQAKKAGYKGVIAHGLFSFGFVIKLLDDFIQQGEYGKIVKAGIEMRHPVRCGDVLVSIAEVKKIENQKIFFDIIQKTQTNICAETQGKTINKYENSISDQDSVNNVIKKKIDNEGVLYFRERINNPGYAIIELFH
ncbi:MAG: MaoC family dehydratase [Promethearchaeota archaeon]